MCLINNVEIAEITATMIILLHSNVKFLTEFLMKLFTYRYVIRTVCVI